MEQHQAVEHRQLEQEGETLQSSTRQLQAARALCATRDEQIARTLALVVALKNECLETSTFTQFACFTSTKYWCFTSTKYTFVLVEQVT